jgi:hypothetical protein
LQHTTKRSQGPDAHPISPITNGEPQVRSPSSRRPALSLAVGVNQPHLCPQAASRLRVKPSKAVFLCSLMLNNQGDTVSKTSASDSFTLASCTIGFNMPWSSRLLGKAKNRLDIVQSITRTRYDLIAMNLST